MAILQIAAFPLGYSIELVCLTGDDPVPLLSQSSALTSVSYRHHKKEAMEPNERNRTLVYRLQNGCSATELIRHELVRG